MGCQGAAQPGPQPPPPPDRAAGNLATPAIPRRGQSPEAGPAPRLLSRGDTPGTAPAAAVAAATLPLVVALVAVVHLATNVLAWLHVGLLADDRFMVFAGAYAQDLPWAKVLEYAFAPALPPDAPVALYRPFSTLPFVFEYPWFGAGALGYHVVNSVVHCTTAVVWYSCWRRVTGSPVAGLAAALLFAGHPVQGEATHWIAARTDLLSTLGTVVALRLWLGADLRGDGALAWRRLLATAFVVFALGCKESAITALPLLLLASWLWSNEPSRARRLAQCARDNAVVWLAAAAWFVVRGLALGTFGFGTESPWQLDVLSPLAWLDALGRWITLLLAPAHDATAFPLQAPFLWVLHGGLLVLALRALRDPLGQRALLFAAAGTVCALLAAAGLHCDLRELCDSRYAYAAVVPLSGLLALGIASLPRRVRWVALAGVLLAHGAALHVNRQSWLEAGAVSARLERELTDEDASSVQLVVDVPAVHHGAFVYLVENPFYAVPPFAAPPPGEPRQPVRLIPANAWQDALPPLAAASASGGLAAVRRVAHDDGRLLPLPVECTAFPREPVPGVHVAFAWAAPAAPHAGEELAVELLAHGDARWQCRARVHLGEVVVESPPRAIEAAAADAPLRLTVPLPDCAGASERITAELVVASESGTAVVPLGLVEIARR